MNKPLTHSEFGALPHHVLDSGVHNGGEQLISWAAAWAERVGDEESRALAAQAAEELARAREITARGLRLVLEPSSVPGPHNLNSFVTVEPRDWEETADGPALVRPN